jgi:hypothetical protein
MKRSPRRTTRTSDGKNHRLPKDPALKSDFPMTDLLYRTIFETLCDVVYNRRLLKDPVLKSHFSTLYAERKAQTRPTIVSVSRAGGGVL